MDGQPNDNPLRDYMQGRQQDYNRAYFDNGVSAALQGLAAIITPAAFGASLPGLAQAIYFGGNAIRNLSDMQTAGQNFDMAGRGAQMWSSTGMPPRPTQMPPPPEEVQQPQQQGAPVNPLYLR